MVTRLPLALAGVFALAAAAPAPEPQLPSFLRTTIQLSAEQIAAMEHGQVVTRQLPTTEKEEIAAFGVVRVGGTPAVFLQKARDVQSLRKVPAIPEIGRFGNPLRVEDLADLTVEEADIDAFRHCRPGKCDVKMEGEN